MRGAKGGDPLRPYRTLAPSHPRTSSPPDRTRRIVPRPPARGVPPPCPASPSPPARPPPRPARPRGLSHPRGLSRRGSVLVFVVALVVLLAVVGTAFLSTARIDRYAVSQHGQNVTTDLLMDGMAEAVDIALTEDLFGTDGQFRPPGQAPGPGEHFEGYDALRLDPVTYDGDGFLAPRVPVKFSPSAVSQPLDYTGPLPLNPPVWRTITAPLIGSTFESPLRPAGNAFVAFPTTYPYPLTYDAADARNVAPTYVVGADNERYPAFAFNDRGVSPQPNFAFDRDPAAPATGPSRILAAADADGDGIADSGYIRLPGGRINDLDWYVGIRIVDLGSAVNVNTAGDRRYDFTFDGNATLVGRLPLDATRVALGAAPTPRVPFNPGFFSTSVGLNQLLRTYDAAPPPVGTPELDETGVESLRSFGRRFGSVDVTLDNVVAGLLGNPGTARSEPIADYDSGARPTGRPDFRYLTFGDALQHELTRRVLNPGLNGDTQAGIPTPYPDNAGTTFPYGAYTLADAAALAYRGGGNYNASAGRSSIERDLDRSLTPPPYTPAAPASPPLPPTDAFRSEAYSLALAQPVFYWFSSLYDYDREDPEDPSLGGANFWRSRRPLLTAYSPSSSLAPVGQDLTATPPGSLVPAAILATDAGAEYPASGVVPKASINAAGDADLSVAAEVDAAFAKLWRAFWHVMAENVTPAGFETPMEADPFYVAPPALDPYRGNEFIPQFESATLGGSEGTFTPGDADGTGGSSAENAPQNVDRQFRSPIRDPGTGTPVTYASSLDPDQTLLLRAGLAAVNLIDLRDADDEVSVRRIQLSATGPTASTFGQERQPYLSEFYANTDNLYVPAPTTPPAPAAPAVANPGAYVALEFYNPYDIPIDLSNCHFVTLYRPPGLSSGLQMLDTETGTFPINLSATTSNLAAAARFGGLPIVPAKGVLVLENYDASGAFANPNANYRPAGSGLSVPAAVATDPPNPIYTGAIDAEAAFGYAAPVAGSPSPVNVVYVANLHTLLNREFVLMRPRGATIDSTVDIGGGGTLPRLVYQQPASGVEPVVDFAPLDSFDATGIEVIANQFLPPVGSTPAPAVASVATSWYYARNTIDPWRFVYPGRYDAGQSHKVAAAEVSSPATGQGVTPPRQQGTFVSGYWTPNSTASNDPADPNSSTYVATVFNGGQQDFGETNFATYDTQFTLPLRDPTTVAGLSPLVNPDLGTLRPATDPHHFPFGGLARNGDLLQVPYVGAYTVRTGLRGAARTGAVLEVNPLSIDSAFADDTDVTTDTLDGNGDGSGTPANAPNEDLNLNGRLDAGEDGTGGGSVDQFLDVDENVLQVPAASFTSTLRYENVGRFAPLFSNRHNDLIAEGSYMQGTGLGGVPDGNALRYRWASDLFDYFDVQVPATDTTPNTGANRYIRETAAAALPPGPPPPTNPPRVVPVANDFGVANGTSDVASPVQGKININTAPEKVLETLPWMPEGTDLLSFNPATGELTTPGTGDTVNDNVDVARAIVYWRDGNPSVANRPPNGPFTSLFDLYRIPAIRVAQAALNGASGAGDLQGDFTPPDTSGTPTLDDVRHDYEEQYLLMTRVSNLITVQSDAFAVYIVLQGWENAGTTEARPVVTQRRAFLFDRSGVTPGDRRGKVVPVATD